MGNDYDSTTPLEWNSNLQVLIRTNYIINNINFYREHRNITSLLDQIVNFYKEIVVDLNEKEKSIWDDIKSLIQMNNPVREGEFVIGQGSNEGVLLMKIDDIDIRLRMLAKRKGYLAANKEDPRKAILQR